MSASGAMKPPDRPLQEDTERAAFERLMSSGLLDRAPNLALLLRYVCERYFEGRAGEIKEYSIATEALGRPPDFDKRRDSIVRVEAYRLRKRLHQFYATTGAAEPVQICIPEGSYIPVFRRVVAEPPGATSTPAVLPQSRHPWRQQVPILAAGVFLAAVAVWWLSARVGEKPAQAAVDAPFVRADDAAVRILAGRSPGSFTDRYGQTWDGDRFFEGGEARAGGPVSGNGIDRNYFAAMREGDFRYAIPISRGTWQLQLYFADTGAFDDGTAVAATRLFSVTANGAALLSSFEPVADAGGSGLPNVKVFKNLRPADDGKLHLAFQGTVQGKAFVNAIELLPTASGRMLPIRMVARREPYRDLDGQLWLPDRFVKTGTVITRPVIPFDQRTGELYRSERYGSFTYAIPLPPGRYGVRLCFNEYWFGPDSPGRGGGGIGSRIFSVYANHRPLLLNFDLFREAGGSMRPIEKIFHGLEPNTQGKLVLDFEPSTNYALLNALEVVDESTSN